MKKLLFVFILLFGCMAAKADTIDIYRVKYRGVQIAQFSGSQILRLVLNADSVFSNDSLFVEVYRDAPCSKGCEYSMLIFGDRGPMMIDSTQHSASFYIPLKPLVEYRRKNGTKEFNGYYTEYLDDKGKSRVIAFKIMLQ